MRNQICAQCQSWECGGYWGSGSGKHGVVIESQGFCTFKKDKNGNVFKRKRWNYCPACKDFNRAKRNSFIYESTGNMVEDLENVANLMKEITNDNL